mgnify:CR=1 FL=1
MSSESSSDKRQGLDRQFVLAVSGDSDVMDEVLDASEESDGSLSDDAYDLNQDDAVNGLDLQMLVDFVRGWHKYGNLEGQSISNESARFFDNFIEREGLEIVQVPNITAGSCSIHLGWTIHGAPANGSNKIREAMTANYFPDGARITDMSRSPDGLRFVGGYLPGQLANGPMNPIVYAEEDA